MAPTIEEGLTPLILGRIKSAYLDDSMHRTDDVVVDMSRDRLSEADLEKFFDDVSQIDKTKKATSVKKWHKNNTHYYMNGLSVDGRKVFCKVSSSYHPKTGQFVCWTLTSFCECKN